MRVLILMALTLSLSKANEITNTMQEFTTGSNLFTAALYQEILKANQGNFVISPFSIHTVLALTQSGAKDGTALEIRRSLHLPNSTQEIEALYTTLLPKVKGNSNYSLHTVNKIYVKNDLHLKDNFKKTAHEVYQSGIENIDFNQNVEAADTINKWVESQTEKKIRELVDPKSLNEKTKAILINALYFKGKWENAFDSFNTQQSNFYRRSNDVIKVPTMSTTDVYNYYESPELKAKFLEMLYKGDDVSMIIVLPNEKEGLSTLETQIEKVFTVLKYNKERVSVSLPKFKIENKVELKPMLKKLGIKKAFTTDADLSGLAEKKGDLLISNVIQKAFIIVTETGTEAAAATAVFPAAGSSMYEEKYKEFYVDHPFLYFLRLNSNNVTLFIGRYKGL